MKDYSCMCTGWWGWMRGGGDGLQQATGVDPEIEEGGGGQTNKMEIGAAR